MGAPGHRVRALRGSPAREKGKDFRAASSPTRAAETSVWYRWTPSITEAVSIDTCSSDFEALIGVHAGAALNALTRVATSEGGPGSDGPFGGKLTLNAVAGTTYFIAVDGFDEGHLTLGLRSLSPVVTPAPVPGFNLKAALKKCHKIKKPKKRRKCVKKAKKRAKSEGSASAASSAPSG